jgi:pSer/pThr/pTyr-binding forkhead associated (FHA) protein
MAILTRLDTGEEYELRRGVTTIGRRETNTIHLDEKDISRGHCRIEGREGHWVLFDSGSASGTFANGRRVHEHQLNSGDTIQIGEVTLRFQIPKPKPPVPGARRLTDGAARKLVPDKVVVHPLAFRLRRWRMVALLALVVLAVVALVLLVSRL